MLNLGKISLSLALKDRKYSWDCARYHVCRKHVIKRKYLIGLFGEKMIK